MKTLKFIRALMRISGIVCVFDKNMVEKIPMFLRFVFCLTGPVHTIMSTITYGYVHIEDFQLVISTVYIIIGSVISASLLISMYIQSKAIQRLLIQIDNLVNES